MQPTFVHLKAHSEYSIQDGLLQIKPWLNAVAEMKMPAVSITDHHNLFALIKFYQYATKLGLKPIIGADIRLQIEDGFFPVTLLCQNNQGYKHLTELLSKAYLEGQTKDGEPLITWSWLVAAHSGLIVLSGGRLGDVGQALLQNSPELASLRLHRWLEVFGDRFYLELQRTGRAQEEDYIQRVIVLAESLQVPVVATNDVRFLHAEDFNAHEARVCIFSGTLLQDPARSRFYSQAQYLRSPQEMAVLFNDLPEALANTVAIAERCTVTLDLGKTYLPNFPVPNQQTLEVYLEEQAENGLKIRLAERHLTSEELITYQKRLRLELDVINNMGFAGYFLIVADFIRWAKGQHIPVGPGRGSGAGSLVAYSLGITAIDPLEHELLFERFLNPERVSMPDFDIDFCMEHRDRVIDYVAERYGREAVSQIITFGTMAAKAVVRDVGRVLGMPYGFVDKIAKLIPFELGITLEKALNTEPRLAERYHQEEDVAALINLAKKLEGVVRNAGKHAGGVVIAPTRLIDFAPLYCEPGGEHVVTQFDKDDVETVGLVKFDFLGLRTLTIIDWTLKAINRKRSMLGEPLIEDLDKMPLDDAKTFELLKSCETTAVFQLESRGMKELIKRLKPDVFEEITALIALFRPGPLQSGMVDDFIARKHGHALVHYPHPKLASVLSATHGVILYQEQVMQIAQTLSGYSLGGADILRRAMGKKKPEEMAKQRQVFVQGAEHQGVEAALAEFIFDLIEKFSGYGFNKSHSAAYAMLTYQTAWLKAHYPAEFMAAVLSSDMDNTDKVVGFIRECERMQVTVLPPNVNVGEYHFMVNDHGQIEYGLGAIKGAGQTAIEHLVLERKEHGHFANLFDFCERLDHRKISRRVIEPFIRSGAMDSFACPRAHLFASIDKALKSAEQVQRNLVVQQMDLFGEATEKLAVEYVSAPEWSEEVRLQGEKETLGWYISGHPLQAYAQEFAAWTSAAISQLSPTLKKTVTIGGVLEAIRVVQTRKGSRMAIVRMADRTGQIEVTLFSKLYDQVSAWLQKDQLYIVSGMVEEDQFSGGVRFRAETFELLSSVCEKQAKQMLLKIENDQHKQWIIAELAEWMRPHLGGKCLPVIEYTDSTHQTKIALGEEWRIIPRAELIEKLKQHLGAENISLVYE